MFNFIHDEDNGTEFANHAQIAAELGVKWFFADPYKSQQRGCNENQNGLIREFYKNETDLSVLTEKDIMSVQDQLNSRPRKNINFKTPKEYLASRSFVALAS